MKTVGILHSLTGSMAISETSLMEAASMAIAEINEQGGVLGETLVAVVKDGGSEPEQFADQALQLIQQHQAVTLFGCWTSSCRKAVQPIVETHNSLLWYPLQYEGLECSPNIFYTGACPNQQVTPAVNWLVEHRGTKFYLIGSDYIFPLTANKLIHAQLDSLGGTVVGETYVPLGHQDFTAVVDEIKRLQPDVIFNTLNGNSNLAFYHQFAQAKLNSDRYPIMAVSIAEVELQLIGADASGHYLSWGYFQSLPGHHNQRFVENFRQRYGSDRVTSDPIEAAYMQVFLWKNAVEKAGSFNCDRVREAAYGLSLEAPSGTITLESNHHVEKSCRIGKILSSGQIESVWHSDPIQPLPWLGVEAHTFPQAPVVTQLLSEVSSWIQKAQQLQLAFNRLAEETESKQKAEAALRISQKALVKAKAELDVARQLQTMLLPSEQELQAIPDLDIIGIMQPAEEVGGDYYEAIYQDSRIYIGIGDVTGHGLESGVVMMIAQAAIRTLIHTQERDRVNFLNVVNQLIYENNQKMTDDRHMTLMLSEYEAGVLHLYGQHESLILVRHDQTLQIVETFELGFPLGIEPDISNFIAAVTIELEPNDVLVFYTDGVTEAMNIDNEQYGLDRLCAIVQQEYQRSVEEIQQAVMSDLHQFIGNQQIFDDITLVVCKRQSLNPQ